MKLVHQGKPLTASPDRAPDTWIGAVDQKKDPALALTAEKLAVEQDEMWFYNMPNPEIWDTSHGDRITEQLAYAKQLADSHPEVNSAKPKVIYNMNNPQQSSTIFKQEGCPVHNCQFSRKISNRSNIDAVIFGGRAPSFKKPQGQVWIWSHLESPYYMKALLPKHDKQINWTATYRLDSTIVTPYEKFVPYDSKISTLPLIKDYSAGKTKMAAWFVSNCKANNDRLQFAQSLGKIIGVDIYGKCSTKSLFWQLLFGGTKSCPRTEASTCFDKLNKHYKFYLSFENSNCKHYITEKFYVNGLW